MLHSVFGPPAMKGSTPQYLVLVEYFLRFSSLSPHITLQSSIDSSHLSLTLLLALRQRLFRNLFIVPPKFFKHTSSSSDPHTLSSFACAFFIENPRVQGFHNLIFQSTHFLSHLHESTSPTLAEAMNNDTRGKTHFVDEPRFDHLSIKDVRNIRAGVAGRVEKVGREFPYKGSLIFRLKFKSNTTNVLVFGRNPDNEDQMIGLRVYDKKGLKDVAYAFKGSNIMALHACKKTLYCNALQLKWAFRDPNIDSDKNYSYIKEAIEQARVNYAKGLLVKFREDDHDAMRVSIDFFLHCAQSDGLHSASSTRKPTSSTKASLLEPRKEPRDPTEQQTRSKRIL